MTQLTKYKVYTIKGLGKCLILADKKDNTQNILTISGSTINFWTDGIDTYLEEDDPIKFLMDIPLLTRNSFNFYKFLNEIKESLNLKPKIMKVKKWDIIKIDYGCGHLSGKHLLIDENTENFCLLSMVGEIIYMDKTSCFIRDNSYSCIPFMDALTYQNTFLDSNSKLFYIRDYYSSIVNVNLKNQLNKMIQHLMYGISPSKPRYNLLIKYLKL